MNSKGEPITIFLGHFLSSSSFIPKHEISDWSVDSWGDSKDITNTSIGV